MLHIRLLIAALITSVTFAGHTFAQLPVQEHLKLDGFRVHDPWILADQPSQTYYLYTASGPQASSQHRSGVVAYKSKDLETWSGPYLVFEVPDGSWADPVAGVWAPEVHFYHGKYYLFATLNNYKAPLPAGQQPANSTDQTHIEVTYGGAGTHLRGSQIFVSDSPSGPFKPVSDKPIPPTDYMSLDGTFYIENGTPYMIYSHEWIQLIDGNMEAIRMTPDLTSSAGDPFFLFKASDAPWLDNRHETVNKPQVYVTDGPELYKTRTGKLLMLWSSYNKGSYVEALAHSTSGKLEGPWKQDGILVGDDSGHGMLFHAFDGRLMLVLHHPMNGRESRGKLYEVEDTGDTIRIEKEVTR
jgi:hypothetical protein